jgi:hypothetical protein
MARAGMSSSSSSHLNPRNLGIGGKTGEGEREGDADEISADI